MRSHYFYSVVIAFFAGVFVGFNTSLDILFWTCTLILSIAVISFLLIFARYKSIGPAHSLLIVMLAILSLSLGAVRIEVRESLLGATSFTPYTNQEVTIIATSIGDVEHNDSTAVLKVYAIKVKDEVNKIKAEKVLLKFPSASFHYNDVLKVSGVLELPENFKGDDGEVFDYASYLERRGIHYSITRPDIVVLDSDKGGFVGTLASIKRQFINNIDRTIPQPASALVSGVTIAGKGSLPEDVENDFIDAGVIHIVVLSGYNIAIVIGILSFLSRLLGRRWGASISIVGIFVFILLAGGSAPIIRAGIMASIIVLGTLSYTKVLQNRALFGTAVIMVLWDPMYLTSDASFALSFLATYAVVNISPAFYARFRIIPEGFWRQTLADTLATQVFVLPYLLYEIGRLSIVAPLSNVFILPLIPVIMFFGFVVGVLGFIHWLALPFAAILYILSMIIIKVANIFANVPLAALNLSIPIYVMISMYAAYFAYSLTARSKRADATS